MGRTNKFLNKKNISKQDIWKRVKDSFVNLVILCLENFMFQQDEEEIQGCTKDIRNKLFGFFGNVFIQDSTNLSLPNKFVKHYKGSVVKGKQRAGAKLQIIFEVTTNTIKQLLLGSFTDNDQGAASFIAEIVKEGDLIIRDLGYFSLAVFRMLIEDKKVHILSRLRMAVSLYDVYTGSELTLMKMTKNKTSIDMCVLVGQKEKLMFRLVGIKLPAKVATERRRKAKANRDKRCKPTKESLCLLGWCFYITTVGEDIWSTEEVAKAYKFRWRIEIIFKTWKSHFSLAKLVDNQELSKIQVESTIYLVLLFIMMIQLPLFHYFCALLLKKKEILLSLVKFSRFVKDHASQIINSLNISEFARRIEYYCRYEKHLKRTNYLELYLCEELLS